MRELSLNEIREKTLDMMDHIHGICEKNGIQYFLMYGTLIGAIRHNGFIPWDDDFDIAMKRNDYIRFCDAVQKENHAYYKLCNRKNTKNYYYGIARYSDSRYTYVSDLDGLKQADNGIFIDIYPLDNSGNTMDEAREIKRKCMKLNTEYMVYMNPVSLRGKLFTALRTPLHYYYRLKYGRDYHLRIDDRVYERIQSLTNDRDKLLAVVCWDIDCTPYERGLFDGVCKHKFEDREYWIPKHYDSVLRAYYGDYMQLPPEDQRVPTHDYKIYEND